MAVEIYKFFLFKDSVLANKVFVILSNQKMFRKMHWCCEFRPANRCSARCLLVKIICFCAFKSNTYKLVEPSFIASFCKFLWGFAFFFLCFLPLVTEKVVSASKNWFWPANGVRSTRSLVKIHNIGPNLQFSHYTKLGYTVSFLTSTNIAENIASLGHLYVNGHI